MRTFLLIQVVGSISASIIGVRPGEVKPRVQNSDMTILCTADSGEDSTGFCTASNKCQESNGRSIGNCESGGVCCKVEASCASTMTDPVTYFQSPGYPEAATQDVACNSNVRVNKKVGQLRVDFIDFEIPGPRQDGRCETNNVFRTFAPSAPNGILGGNEQVGLCGLNKGQHLYIEVEPNDVVQMHFTLSGTSVIPNDMAVSLASSVAYKWNLKITQVEFDSDNEAMKELEAPAGCLQYFKDNFGSLTSFNLDGVSRFSPEQNYFICISQKADRDFRTDCGVELRAQVFGLPFGSPAGCEPGDSAVVTEEATDEATEEGTDEGTEEGTDEATEEGTDEATEEVVDEATEEGTDEATEEGTDEATEEGADEAADEATGCTMCCVASDSSSLGVVAYDEGLPDTLRYRYCGKKLGGGNQITTEPSPYMINVKSGTWARTKQLPDWAVGFHLTYKINFGSC
eukprot:GFUD01025708.1.p1 GENE.GFUD01025708.1~~GFUD01025708.1.p1  ORF type:complete len:458 (-),score=54.71 GFUD01025708.1:63-1436(-)